MRRNIELEATTVEKYAAVEAYLDERGRRIWAATESRAIGYGGDALVSDATGLSRPTIRKGRRELESGGAERGRIRRPGAGRPGIKQSQPGIKQALEKLVDPVTHGDPQSPLRWTCKSRAKLAAALTNGGWKVSTTTVGRLLHELGYRLQSARKSREGASHPDRNEQFEHINARADEFDAHAVAQTYAARWQIELIFKELKSYYPLEELPTRKAYIVETLLLGAVITLLVSRRLLLAVQERLRRISYKMPEQRWAAIFAAAAPAILDIVVLPPRVSKVIARRLESMLLHKAPDPNRSWKLLIEQVECGAAWA